VYVRPSGLTVGSADARTGTTGWSSRLEADEPFHHLVGDQQRTRIIDEGWISEGHVVGDRDSQGPPECGHRTGRRRPALLPHPVARSAAPDRARAKRFIDSASSGRGSPRAIGSRAATGRRGRGRDRRAQATPRRGVAAARGDGKALVDGRVDQRLPTGNFLRCLTRYLFGEMAGRQLAAAHVAERRIDGGALLRVAQLLSQPAAVWKRQPDGGLAGDGTSPRSTRRFLRTRGSGLGIADSRATLYGWRGPAKS